MYSRAAKQSAAQKLQQGRCPINCGLPAEVRSQLKSGEIIAAGHAAMTVIPHGALMCALQKKVRCQASQPAPSALPASLCPAPSALPACVRPSALPCPSPPMRLVAHAQKDTLYSGDEVAQILAGEHQEVSAYTLQRQFAWEVYRWVQKFNGADAAAMDPCLDDALFALQLHAEGRLFAEDGTSSCAVAAATATTQETAEQMVRPPARPRARSPARVLACSRARVLVCVLPSSFNGWCMD